MTKDELLDALLVERHNGIAWANETREAERRQAERVPEVADPELLLREIERQEATDELLRAKRRRQMAEDFKRSYESEAG